MSGRFWTKAKLEKAKEVLKKHTYISEAAQELSDLFGETVAPGSLSYALPEYCGIKPGDLLKNASNKYKRLWWTKDKIEKAKKILSESKTLYAAVLAIQKELKFPITEDSLRTAFTRHEGSGNLMDYLKKGKRKKKTDEKESEIDLIVNILGKHKNMKPALKEIKNKVGISDTSLRKLIKNKFGQGATPGEYLKGSITQVEETNEQIEELVKLAKKRTKSRNNKFLTFRELCDTMDLSPGKAENLIDEAKALGYTLNVSDDVLYLDIKPSEKQGNKYQVSIPKKEKNKITFAAISDTHCGSKYCMKEEIKHFVDLCYNDYGITTIFHSGDCLAGNKVYRGQPAELEDWSGQGQAEIFADILPEHKGLQYTAILGNHDVDFIKSNGFDPSFVISKMRKDVNFIGHIKGRCLLGDTGIEVELIHVKSSARTRSYGPEKHVFYSMSPSDYAHLVLCGHLHSMGYFLTQASHVFLVPCFENLNLFLKYYDMYPSIGGIVVSLILDDENSIVRCENSFHMYSKQTEKKEIITIK